MELNYTKKILEKVIASFALKFELECISVAALDIFVDAIIEQVKLISREAGRIVEDEGRTDVNMMDIYRSIGKTDKDNIALIPFYRQIGPGLTPFMFYIEEYPKFSVKIDNRNQNDKGQNIEYGENKNACTPKAYGAYPHVYADPRRQQTENQRSEKEMDHQRRQMNDNQRNERDLDCQSLQNLTDEIYKNRRKDSDESAAIGNYLVEPPKRFILQKPTGLLYDNVPIMTGTISDSNPENVEFKKPQESDIVEEGNSVQKKQVFKIFNKQ